MNNCYALFRHAFDLGAIPAHAPLFITADQSYHLYVNGSFVGRGPARGYQRSWPYDEVDIRPFLRKGRNLLAVRAYNPGGSNFQYVTQGYAGLLVAARWGRTVIGSGGAWRAIRQLGMRRDTAPVSLQLPPQEHIDLRDDTNVAWMRPDFDDQAWPAPVARSWNSEPWVSLEARGLPPLAEKQISPAALIGVGEGVCNPEYQNTRDVVAIRQTETRGHRPAQAAGSCVEVGATKKGGFRSYLYDFGRTVVGNLVLDVRGAAGGEVVDTHFAETIRKDTLTPDQVIPTHSRMAFGGRAILRTGDNQHAFFHHYGFRYLMVTVREPKRPLSLDVSLRWTGYPLRQNGAFSSSDPDLVRIWETCAWTQQCCSLDTYVDTPWREQAQWWGDARVQAWNTFHFDGDTRLFRRGIRQIAGQTTSDGVTYGHAPTMAHNCILPDFTLIWFLTLWDYYWQTGSIEPFRTHRGTVENALDYFEQRLHSSHNLLSHDERYWLFLDWTGILKDGYPALYSLWFLHAVRKLRVLYARLPAGEKKAATGVVNRLEKMEQRVERGLANLIGKDGLLHDGLTWKGRRVAETSIHTQTLAITVGLDRKNDRARIDRILRPYVRGEYNPEVQPSAYWITYVFAELIVHGHGQEVVECIRRRWGAMAEYGTTWETFAPEIGGESHSHAWSAHPLYHLMQTVGGVIQTAPAWKQIDYCPVFHGDYGGSIVPTPHGLITTQWKRKEDAVEVLLQLPRGVVARVFPPGAKPKTVKGRASFEFSQPKA